MAAKKGPVKSTTSSRANQIPLSREFAHKAALAYVGAFGVAADELGKLFELFVTRGEQMEKDARKLAKQNGKQVRLFATQVQKEQKATAVRANKTVKQAVKRVEEALAS